MYHPAPAVKRGHLGNVKSGGCIALPGLLKILLCGADESALLGWCNGGGGACQRVRTAGLDLTQHDGPVRLPQDEVDLPHPGAVIVGQQQAAPLLVIARGDGLAFPAGLGGIHHLPSGQ